MSKQDAVYSRGRTYYVAGVGILFDHGTTVPTDGVADYAPGCVFQKTDGGEDTNFYINQGTLASSDFKPLDVASPVGTAAGRGGSPLIWDNCPVLDYMVNPQAGMYFFDDLLDGVDCATNKSAAQAAALGTTGVFGAYTGTTGNTLASVATNSQGATTLSTTTDNQEAQLIWPKGGTVAGKVKFVTGKKLWFECRVQFGSIATAINQVFIGFAEEGLNSTGALLLINEAGLADKDYVGFLKEYTDGDGLNTEFNTDGGTNVSNGDEATLTAATWIKLGIYCDGSTVTFYVDGVALTTTTTTATAHFPNDEELVLYFVNMCGGAGTTGTLVVDWVRIAQEY